MSHLRLVAFAAVVLASPAFAELPALSGSIGYSAEVFSDRSWDLVDDDDHLPMLRVGGGVSFPMGRAFVDVEAAFQHGATSQPSHGGVQSELWLRGLRVGAAYRYDLLQYLQPYVHLGGGLDWATLTLLSADRLTQTVLTPSGVGLVGIQVPVRMGVKSGRLPFLIFDLGLGAVVRPAARFSALQPRPPERTPKDPIAVAAVNAGSLPLTGFTGRLLMTVRW